METGHAKNVANFETVIIILISLGALYNPVQALILLPALQAKLDAAKDALAALDAATANKTIKIDEFLAELEGLDKYVVNIKRVAEISVNDPAFTADLQSIINRMRPQTRSTGVPDDPTTPDIDESRTARSTSMRSYDNQIAFLADVAALVTAKGSTYESPEAEYKLDAIQDKVARLTTKLNAAKTAVAVEGSAMDTRDAELYDDETGVLKLVKLIKAQLALKPGKQSAAYQQINALQFVRKRN